MEECTFQRTGPVIFTKVCKQTDEVTRRRTGAMNGVQMHYAAKAELRKGVDAVEARAAVHTGGRGRSGRP
jgi:hypothetical protein